MSASMLAAQQAAPVTPTPHGGVLCRIDDEPEVARRQAEWERQIESLDQREFELHQTQLRLIRGQMATVMHDINALRQEVATLEAEQRTSAGEFSSTLAKEISFVQGRVGGLEREQREELASLRSAVLDVQASIAPQLNELKSSTASELQLRAAAQKGLEQRLAELGDSIAKQGQQHQELDRRLTLQKTSLQQELEKSSNHLQNLLAEHVDSLASLEATLDQEKSAREFQHGSANDRLSKLEKDVHSNLFKVVSSCELGLQELREIIGGSANHGSMGDALSHTIAGRLASLEQAYTDAADRGEMERTSKTLIQLQSRVAEHATQLLQQSSAQERLSQTLEEASDKQVEDISAACVKIEQINGRLSGCERSSSSLAELQRSHSSLANDVATRHTQMLDIAERLSRAEGDVGSLLGKHASDVDMLKAELTRFELSQQRQTKEVEALKVTQASFASFGERLGQLEGALSESSDKSLQDLASLGGKLEQLSGKVSACEKYGTSLSELKKAQAGFATEKAVLETQQGDLQGRLGQLEVILSDFPSQHSAMLSKLEQMQGRLAACERSGAQLGDLQKAQSSLTRDLSTCSSAQAALKDTVDEIQETLSPLHEKHAKELQDLKAAHAKLASDAKAHGSKVGDLLSQHQDARDQHHATVQERLNYLEGLVEDSADKHEKHIKALEAQKVAHAKLASEMRTRDSGNTTLSDRLGLMEKALHEAADRHAQELAAACGRLDDLQGRCVEDRAAREKQAAALETLKKAHASLSSERAMSAGDQAGLSERMDALEQALEEATKTHLRDMEATKAAQARLASEVKAREPGSATATFSTNGDPLLSERVDTLVQKVQELAGVHDKHGATTGSHAKELEALRKASVHWTVVTERIDAVERAQRESSSELVDLVRKEQDARNSQYTSHGERLRTLEARVSEEASKARREVEERSKETKLIWEAIDSHTHDLAGQILDTDREPTQPVNIEVAESRVVVPPPKVLRPEVSTNVVAPPTAVLSSPSATVLVEPPAMGSMSSIRTSSSLNLAHAHTAPLMAPTAAVITNPVVRQVSYQGGYQGYQPGATVLRLGTGTPGPPLIRSGLVQSASVQSLTTATQPAVAPSATDLFDQLDTDHSGHLSREEFQKLMGKLGHA